MGSIVSRALCLSAHRRDRHSLPPKPPDICQHCWEGPFAANLGFCDALMEEVYDDMGGRLIGGYRYWTSEAQMVPDDCMWCRLLTRLLRSLSFQEGLSRSYRFGTHRYDHSEFSVAVGRGIAAGLPQSTQMLVISIAGILEFQGHVHTASGDPTAPYIVARNPVLDVGSPRAFSLARACLNDCAVGHGRCIQISTACVPLLPTRVIDCTDPHHPRLSLTDRRRGRYLALSYVWGEPQPHQTTSSNVAAYESGIDPALLPATIREAIHVTRALGFRYLWADSLCIIQDSGEDQRHEIGQMHLIYRYAYLTIIAANAKRVSDGFLQDRQTGASDIRLPFLCPRAPARAKHSADSSVTATQALGEVRVRPTYTRKDRAIANYSHATEPISARGWCLQEYLMSPRALVFTSETLQFRCQTATRNVGDAFYDPTSEARLPDLLFLPDPPPVERGSGEWADVHRRWCAVIEDYSQRALGKPSDKLVACGAIAEAFQRVLRSEYLAGLWRATLLQDLLWRRDWDCTSALPANYRAPSWSWAAFDGRVWMLGRNYAKGIAVAEVASSEVVLKDDELRFGEVKAATLVLRAALVRCLLRVRASEKKHEILLPSIHSTQAWRGGGGGGGSDEAGLVLDRELPDGGWASIDSKADAAVRCTWFVPLLRTDSEPSRVGGLVVTLAKYGGEGKLPAGGKVFRRVGMFYIRDWGALRAYGTPAVDIELV